jgi:hypothetical protein
MPSDYKRREPQWPHAAVHAPGEIRTPDLLIRSQTLYPAELRAQGLHRATTISRLQRERAGNRARTGDLNLGKVALYQLSYARVG